MANSVPDRSAVRHLPTPEIGRPRMAKADLPKAEIDPWRVEVGRVVARAKELSGLSLKQFADAVKRDERQVSRWCDGTERAQLDAFFAAGERVRVSLLIALAESVRAGVDIMTEIRIRRPA